MREALEKRKSHSALFFASRRREGGGGSMPDVLVWAPGAAVPAYRVGVDFLSDAAEVMAGTGFSPKGALHRVAREGRERDSGAY
jgi:hypothetical protein